MKFYTWGKRSVNIIRGYCHDCSKYLRYHYGNPYNNSQSALMAKLLRQEHIIEKGLSIENPRKGFGQEKLKTLFSYLDEWMSAGYPANNAFNSSVHCVLKYCDFQEKLDFDTTELRKKAESYLAYDKSACHMTSGFEETTKEKIEAYNKGDFKTFYENRHSIRQFSAEPITQEEITQAIKLAQRAPSACNRQCVKVYYYNEEADNQAISRFVPGNTGFAEEGVKYLILTSDLSAFNNAYERNQIYVDGGIFALSVSLSLQYYNIASCIMQNGESNYAGEKRLRANLKNIPNNEKIICFIAVGKMKDEFRVAKSTRNEIESVLKIK